MIIEITLKGIFFVILYLFAGIGLCTFLYLVRAAFKGFVGSRKERKIMFKRRAVGEGLNEKELSKTRDNARKKGDL